jgi:hypothetical protein
MGIEHVINSGVIVRKKILPVVLRSATVVCLLFWLIPSVWSVCVLKCRGADYKGLAEWINRNVAENGIYTYGKAYDTVGVPGIYPTPGRFPSYPRPWDTPEHYKQFRIRDRMRIFFLRFPMACLVERCPTDKLAPTEYQEIDPLPRKELFARQIWLKDEAFRFLVRMKTWPQGEVPWDSCMFDKTLVSFNRPEDLPLLALQRGEMFFHYFGPEWQYTKDPSMNDWRVIVQSGTLFAGNISRVPASVKLRLVVFAVKSSCKCMIYGPDGNQIVEVLVDAKKPRVLNISNVTLQPGVNKFSVEMISPAQQAKPYLLVGEFRVLPLDQALPVQKK